MQLWGASAYGLDFGAPQAQAALGSALSFTVPLRAAAGETLAADCLQPEVVLGDRQLPAYELRWQLLPAQRPGERLLRLSTLGAVDEPVVSVRINSVCGRRQSQVFTLLAQPLALAAGAAASAVAAPPGSSQPPAGRVPGDAATGVAHLTPAAPQVVSRPASLRLAAALPLSAAVAAVAVVQQLPDTTGLGLALGAQVAGDQVQALEKQVAQMLVEARRQQEQLRLIRQRLAAAEAANAWLPWLVLGLMAAVALVAWLALRLRRLQRSQRQAMLAGGAAAVRSEAPVAERPEVAPPLLSTAQPLLSGAASSPAVAPTAAAALTVSPPAPMSAGAMPTQPLPTMPALRPADFSLGTGVPPRPVSVEELLDLDQQVDFFMVLGQEQAAIDLLLAHVRSTGGGNALPYFKLLEIYRAVGDEDAYERTRDRFNQRFNALAPGWSGDLQAGRTLEDYPAVMARLQRAWPQPLRAVAELESLLFRRADLEPFDLPAYRDILMLHALVRELPVGSVESAPMLGDRVPGSGSAVDLLLPLDSDEDPSDTTSPRPHLSESRSAQARLAEWVASRTTGLPRLSGANELMDDLPRPARPAKLDLDLSEFAPAPREFTRPAAFTDVDMRRDAHRSDLTPFDDSDLLPPPASRT